MADAALARQRDVGKAGYVGDGRRVPHDPFASGDLASASEAFQAGGDVAAGYYNLGIVHMAAGRYVEAGRAFQRAIDSRPAFTAAKTRAHEARMRALGADDRRQP